MMNFSIQDESPTFLELFTKMTELVLANYVKKQIKQDFGSFQNVMVYDKTDYNIKFYITEMCGQLIGSIRYLMSYNTVPFKFSTLITQVNYTIPSQKTETTKIVERVQRNFQYFKTKSPFVTSYTRKRNILSHFKNFYMKQRNCSVYQRFFRVKYVIIQMNIGKFVLVTNTCLIFLCHISQYDKQVQYYSYGIGINIWHVYAQRNYNSG